MNKILLIAGIATLTGQALASDLLVKSPELKYKPAVQEEALGAIKGDQFIAANGFLAMPSGSGSNNSFALVGQYGRYIQDQIVASVQVIYLKSGGTDSYAIGLDGRYDFVAHQKTTPYAHVGFATAKSFGGSSSGSASAFDAGVGVDFHLTRQAAFNVDFTGYKAQGVSDTLFLLSFGLKFFIKS